MTKNSKQNKLIDPWIFMGVLFMIVVPGCATVASKYNSVLHCTLCNKEMTHIVERDKGGKMFCKTCSSEISETGKEHYCTSCGTRIEDFSTKIPF